MEKSILRDKHGKKIGTIENSGDRLIVRDEHGSRCGSYDIKSDNTYDAHGVKIGSGNLLVALIPNICTILNLKDN